MLYTREIDQRTSDEKHNDSLEIENLQDKLFASRQHFNAFITSLEKRYPSYYELKYRTPHLSISDIRKKLDANQAYLDYFVGDSTIYTFEITNDNYTVASSPIDSSSFSKKLKDFRKAIVDADWQSYTRIGYQLYQKLIGPVKDNVKGKELLIVPDAQLSLVPFDALLTAKTSNIRSGGYAGLPYLIKKHAVMYGYSPYLIFRRRSKEVVHSTGFLGMAPVFDQPADTLSAFKKLTKTNTVPPLMSSLQEVKGIYKLVSANPVMKAESHIYLRSQATESKLKSPEISHYRYIHLATHAYVNEKKPSLSGILFYPAKKDSDDDGILYTGDIYNLNLNARLVVLSACETATGQMVRGEGIIGFSRAFLYAGARNVMVSLWNVYDRSSPDLMTKFYRHLLGDEDVAHSLQRAKIEMIKEKRYSMPVYWASMIQIR
jgi:CHAT domain-containing protein